jgi:endoglucanase
MRWLACAALAILSPGCSERVYIGNIPRQALADEAGPSYPTVPGFLRVEGTAIVDKAGRAVMLRGINWAGMETPARVPDGLHLRKLDELMAQIASLGFNFIRIPFCNDALAADSVPSARNVLPGVGNPALANPELAGLTSLQILDRIVDSAARHGIMIVLSRYRSTDAADDRLWYSAAYSEARWIADWTMLAQHFAPNNAVVGFDLHNGPASPAVWGGGDPATDWTLAAAKAGSAILAANPELLVIVEGVDLVDGKAAWPGANLREAKAQPVLLPREHLVYASRDFGPSTSGQLQEWFTDASYPANLPALWYDRWESLVADRVAPVLLVAFGASSGPVLAADDALWLQTLTSYLREHDLGSAYWALNPSAEGLTGLFDRDWATTSPVLTSLP